MLNIGEKVSTLWEINELGHRDVVMCVCQDGQGGPLKSHCSVLWITWLAGGPLDIPLTQVYARPPLQG